MKRSTNATTNIYISQDIYKIHIESSKIPSPYFSLDATKENHDSNTVKLISN
jgi:hypothetical protein